MAKLTGKVAVVTGASKGIGAGIAKALASAGASVVVNYASDRAGAERVVSEITKDGGRPRQSRPASPMPPILTGFSPKPGGPSER